MRLVTGRDDDAAVRVQGAVGAPPLRPVWKVKAV